MRREIERTAMSQSDARDRLVSLDSTAKPMSKAIRRGTHRASFPRAGSARVDLPVRGHRRDRRRLRRASAHEGAVVARRCRALGLLAAAVLPSRAVLPGEQRSHGHRAAGARARNLVRELFCFYARRRARRNEGAARSCIGPAREFLAGGQARVVLVAAADERTCSQACGLFHGRPEEAVRSR